LAGVLVTADYGRDAYDFIAGKTLTLPNEGNLLSLLPRHGRRDRTNLEEARRVPEGK